MQQRRALVLLGVAAVLFLFTSDAAKLFSPLGTDYARTLNLPLWASVALLAAMLQRGVFPAAGAASERSGEPALAQQAA